MTIHMPTSPAPEHACGGGGGELHVLQERRVPVQQQIVGQLPPQDFKAGKKRGGVGPRSHQWYGGGSMGWFGRPLRVRSPAHGTTSSACHSVGLAGLEPPMSCLESGPVTIDLQE